MPVPFDLIHKAFEARVASNPNAIAVEHTNDSLTYQELDRQANRLAAMLRDRGVKPGDAVGLFIQRSIPMVAGILAILKTGAAYVPQHVRVAPQAQLSHVITATGMSIILTLADLEEQLPDTVCSHLLLDEIIATPFNNEFECKTAFVPDHGIQPDDRAIVLFTSGTTGPANGVQVTHRNLCNILLTEPGSMGMTSGMKVGQILSIAFDMSAWEILGSLSHGATLLIRGQSIQETAERADVLIATPSVLVSLDAARCHNVKMVAVAGEPCPLPLADRWTSFCRFHNACGPTETTIVNTVKRHTAGKPLSIGTPTPNNTVYILDENRMPVAIGEIGEMWAGGACVTRGYLNNPALTNDRYAPDPYLGGEHRMFRTGDLGRWTRNGELEHLGRTDDQVKCRGFRIELDSVSAVIESVAHCEQAATLKYDSQTLVSFVTPASIDPAGATAAVATELPYYCVPEFVFAIDQLPRTNRGKVDKALLREMAAQQIEQVRDAIKGCGL
jgi:amino acid adenylation domain-containing protein